MPPHRIRRRNPHTGEVVADLPAATPAQVRDAIRRARAAQPGWAALPLRRRVEMVERVATRLGELADEIAPIITREVGKPIRESRGEVGAAQRRIRHIVARAAQCLARPSRVKDPASDIGGSVFREPLGVAAVITAWNYPVSVSSQVIASALIAGNTVIFKPSELTPLAGRRLGEIFAESLPPDVMITIDGAKQTGRALVRGEVDVVGFVGSCAVGKSIMAAGAKRLVRLALELGGKDPAIILHDADLDHAAQSMLGGAFWNCGQECNSVERVYVDRRVEREFLRRLIAAVKTWKMGDPRRDTTALGPMVTAEQRRRVEAHVRDAVKRGARVLVGGKRPQRKGLFYPATVLSGVDHSMRIMREETFGPVLPVMAFDTEKEAVALANDTPYGLTGSVWSRDVRRAKALARRLVAGHRAVNMTGGANPAFPWGGAKESGLGRLMGPDPFVDFTEERGVMVRG